MVTSVFRADLINWVVTNLLSDNVDSFLPIGFQFAWTSPFCNVANKNPVTWL